MLIREVNLVIELLVPSCRTNGARDCARSMGLLLGTTLIMTHLACQDWPSVIRDYNAEIKSCIAVCLQMCQNTLAIWEAMDINETFGLTVKTGLLTWVNASIKRSDKEIER